jgi:hypothetical protein
VTSRCDSVAFVAALEIRREAASASIHRTGIRQVTGFAVIPRCNFSLFLFVAAICCSNSAYFVSNFSNSLCSNWSCYLNVSFSSRWSLTTPRRR